MPETDRKNSRKDGKRPLQAHSASIITEQDCVLNIDFIYINIPTKLLKYTEIKPIKVV